MPFSLIVVFSMAAQVNYELDYQRLNSSTNSQSALNPVYAHAQVYDVQVLNVYGRRELKLFYVYGRCLGQIPIIISLVTVEINTTLLEETLMRKFRKLIANTNRTINVEIL